jgi:putative FmdB family regulatory protein
MPIYEFVCKGCGLETSRVTSISERNGPHNCERCGDPLTREIRTAQAPRFAGRVVQGGGPDRFTADMLGIPLKELPSGLRTR